MKLKERVEYDEDSKTLTVNGINPSQEPYSVEIVGEGSLLWFSYLNQARYRRRCVGDYKERFK